MLKLLLLDCQDILNLGWTIASNWRCSVWRFCSYSDCVRWVNYKIIYIRLFQISHSVLCSPKMMRTGWHSAKLSQ